MTREEAIQEFQNVKDLIRQDGKDWFDERDLELIDMAIEALKTDVVYCKDCKHYIVEGITTQYGWCHEYKHSVNEDDYCSYGERKK